MDGCPSRTLDGRRCRANLPLGDALVRSRRPPGGTAHERRPIHGDDAEPPLSAPPVVDPPGAHPFPERFRLCHRLLVMTRPTLLATILVLSALVGACGPTASPSPTPSPTPTPVLVTTPEAAWDAVVKFEPRFEGIGPRDPDAIGQSAWYEISPASGVGAFVVSVTVGWGDCEAGCIDHHTWVLAVTPDGGVRILSEQGSEVPAGILPDEDGGRTGIEGVATAGPVCPVETNPPDPSCAPRPVVNAPISVLDGSGSSVASTTTDANGAFSLDVPAGEYTLVGGAVEGLMGAPAPTPVTVTDGLVTSVDLSYDTGIR